MSMVGGSTLSRLRAQIETLESQVAALRIELDALTFDETDSNFKVNGNLSMTGKLQVEGDGEFDQDIEVKGSIYVGEVAELSYSQSNNAFRFDRDIEFYKSPGDSSTKVSLKDTIQNITTLQGDITTLQGDIDDLDEDINGGDGKDGLKKELSDLEGDLSALEGRVKTVEDANTADTAIGAGSDAVQYVGITGALALGAFNYANIQANKVAIAGNTAKITNIQDITNKMSIEGSNGINSGSRRLVLDSTGLKIEYEEQTGQEIIDILDDLFNIIGTEIRPIFADKKDVAEITLEGEFKGTKLQLYDGSNIEDGSSVDIYQSSKSGRKTTKFTDDIELDDGKHIYTNKVEAGGNITSEGTITADGNIRTYDTLYAVGDNDGTGYVITNTLRTDTIQTYGAQTININSNITCVGDQQNRRNITAQDVTVQDYFNVDTIDTFLAENITMKESLEMADGKKVMTGEINCDDIQSLTGTMVQLTGEDVRFRYYTTEIQSVYDELLGIFVDQEVAIPNYIYLKQFYNSFQLIDNYFVPADEDPAQLYIWQWI